MLLSYKASVKQDLMKVERAGKTSWLVLLKALKQKKTPNTASVEKNLCLE